MAQPLAPNRDQRTPSAFSLSPFRAGGWRVAGVFILVACGSDEPLQLGGGDPRAIEDNADSRPKKKASEAHAPDSTFFDPGPPVDHRTRFPQHAAALEGQGLFGRMHAVVPERDLAVFTWRQPGNFFDFVDFPLVPTEQARDKVMSLQRHDGVTLKGAFINNRAPMPHIRVSDLELLDPYTSRHPTRGYQHDTKLPDDLLSNTELIGKVHAVFGDGQILVIEVGDAVVPVFSREPKETLGLFRNDKIRLQYRVSSFPGSPAHVWIDDTESALEVLDSMQAKHDTASTLEGVLTLYPESPQITRDIFAVQVSMGDGVQREYTLVNLDDPKVFIEIQDKAAAAWEAAEDEVAINARNKLVKPTLRVTATGILNVVDPNQANPQILLEGPEAFTIEVVSQ